MEKNMKIGLVSVTFRNRSAEEVLSLCRENGVDVIEWGGDIHVPTGDYETAKRVGEMTRAGGMEVFSYGSYYRLGEQEDWEKAFAPVLRTAECLQGSYIRVWAGTKSSRMAGEEDFRNAEEELRQICRMAEQSGMRIALEYHRNTLTEDWKSALRLAEETKAPNLFLYWQPNPDISQEEKLEELRRLRDWICNVHTFFWEKGNIRRPLKEGESMWSEYAEMLKGKDIPYMLEFVKDDEEQQFFEDLETLRHLL